MAKKRKVMRKMAVAALKMVRMCKRRYIPSSRPAATKRQAR
uniref:Uncharacterized protein n=1 Tax=Arundo donax TaxID=35708 RepID=A0A0A8YZJ4_ARUDO